MARASAARFPLSSVAEVPFGAAHSGEGDRG